VSVPVPDQWAAAVLKRLRVIYRDRPEAYRALR